MFINWQTQIGVEFEGLKSNRVDLLKLLALLN